MAVIPKTNSNLSFYWILIHRRNDLNHNDYKRYECKYNTIVLRILDESIGDDNVLKYEVSGTNLV